MTPTLIDAWHTRYPKVPVVKLAGIYEQANDCSLTWDSITKGRLAAFTTAMRAYLSQNSVQFYCKSLKAVLGLYSDEVELPKGFEQPLTIKSEGVVSTWLTEDDIDYLTQVDTRTESEKIIRAQFLIGCLTGARHSDYEHFTSKNIVGDSLVYVAQLD